eukprot:m.315910 g.315910  ORF g.315910 m.315910 type:complete len:1007 (+) comp27534_c0_seq2:238-3258(+)
MLSSGSPPAGAPAAAGAAAEPQPEPPQASPKPARGIAERKLQASLLSIKMFWAPELERERKVRLVEKTRAEKAERVLKEQLEKGVRYMQKLVHLEAAYEELEIGAQKQGRLEAELRASLEAQLSQKFDNARDGGGGGAAGAAVQAGPDLAPKVAAQAYEIRRLQKDITDASDQVALLRRQLDMTEGIAAKAAESQKAADTERRQSQAKAQKIKLLTAQLSAMTTQRDKKGQLAVGLEAHIGKAISARAEAQGRVEELEIELDIATRNATTLEAEASAAAAETTAMRAEVDASRREAKTMREAEVAKSLKLRKKQEELISLQKELVSKTAEAAAATAVADAATATQEMLRVEHSAGLEVEHSRRAVLDNEVETLCDRLADLEETSIAERDAVVEAAAQQSMEHQRKLDALTDTISELRGQLSSRNAEHQAAVEELTAGVAALTEQLSRSNDEHQAKAAEFTEVVTELEGQLAQRSSEISTMTAELAQSASARDGTQAELQGQLARLEVELLNAQKELKKSRRAQKVAETAMTERQKGGTELEAELQRHKTKSASSSKRATAALGKAALAQQMQSVAEEQVTAMKADLKTATAALTDARSKLVAARAAAETAKKSAGAAEANKQLQKNLAAENKQLRDLHEAELNRVKKAQRQALATLTDQNQKLQESYDEQVKQMTDGHQQIADELESQTQQLRKAHEAEIAQLSEARNQTAAELTAKIAEYDDMKLNTTASSAANGNLSAEKEMLTKRAKRLGAEKEELRKALDAHTADTAALATTLAERDDELARARAELMRSRQELQETKSTHSRSIRDVEEKVMADRTNELLEVVSEMDTKIAALEAAGAKKNREQIQTLIKERLVHVDKLKDQFDKQAEMLDNSSRISEVNMAAVILANENGGSDDSDLAELISDIELRHEDCARMRVYVSQLVSEVKKQEAAVSSVIMADLPQVTLEAPGDNLKSKSLEELKGLQSAYERDSPILEEMVDTLLNRIVEHCPQLLETLQAAL